MKKKIAAIMLMVFAMPLFSLAMPKAEAASLGDLLSEVSAGNTTAISIEELLQIKENFDRGNKQVLLGTLAQTALARTGKAELVNDIGTVAAQLAAQDPEVAKKNITLAVETTVRSKMEEKLQAEVSERLAGYQNEMALLSTLLTTTNTYLGTQSSQN